MPLLGLPADAGLGAKDDAAGGREVPAIATPGTAGPIPDFGADGSPTRSAREKAAPLDPSGSAVSDSAGLSPISAAVTAAPVPAVAKAGTSSRIGRFPVPASPLPSLLRLAAGRYAGGRLGIAPRFVVAILANPACGAESSSGGVSSTRVAGSGSFGGLEGRFNGFGFGFAVGSWAIVASGETGRLAGALCKFDDSASAGGVASGL